RVSALTTNGVPTSPDIATLEETPPTGCFREGGRARWALHRAAGRTRPPPESFGQISQLLQSWDPFPAVSQRHGTGPARSKEVGNPWCSRRCPGRSPRRGADDNSSEFEEVPPA